VVVYDSQTVAVSDLPNSADDVVAPRWAGQVAVAPGNASFQSLVTAYRVIKGDAAAEQWAENLANNSPEIFEKNSAIVEAVNDGSIQIGLTNHYYWYRLAEERGGENLRAQLHFPVKGDPASIVNVTGAGVLKAHAGDQDAFDLVAFLVSDQAQQYFVDVTFEYPLVSSIAAPAGLPALSELAIANFDLSDLRSLKETQSLLQKFGLIL
jgi:iron(III) transport system substrate-binding protein